jgi:hypothetical protein
MSSRHPLPAGGSFTTLLLYCFTRYLASALPPAASTPAACSAFCVSFTTLLLYSIFSFSSATRSFPPAACSPPLPRQLYYFTPHYTTRTLSWKGGGSRCTRTVVLVKRAVKLALLLALLREHFVEGRRYPIYSPSVSALLLYCSLYYENTSWRGGGTRFTRLLCQLYYFTARFTTRTLRGGEEVPDLLASSTRVYLH